MNEQKFYKSYVGCWWKCERCGKLIPYMADFCHECADELLGESPKPFEPQEDNCFYDEIMDDESDGEVYEKIKEIISKEKEQEDTYKYLLHGAESLVKENPEVIEALQNIPTMYYPQVEGVTPTVVSTGKQEPFDEYGNYKYPSDFELTEPNTATSMPCDDAISRQAALDCFTATKLKKFDFILYARAEIKKLPPVNPQNCDNCEVGNPCIYCKHEFEPQERSCEE